MICDFAIVLDAAALFTFRFVDVHAVTGLRACDTQSIAVANIRVARKAWSAPSNGRIVGLTSFADVVGARIVIIKYVGIVIEFFIEATFANMQLAIADDGGYAWRRKAIEIRVYALAGGCIAQIFRTRILIVAIGIFLTRDLARPRVAGAHFRALIAGCIVR